MTVVRNVFKAFAEQKSGEEGGIAFVNPDNNISYCTKEEIGDKTPIENVDEFISLALGNNKPKNYETVHAELLEFNNAPPQ